MTGNLEVMTAGEVKSHSSIDRFLVVFHSPTGNAETGPLACRSEKTGRVRRCNANTTDFLCSGSIMETSELAEISRDFRGKPADFSALQTAWRRGRDSNLRYSFVALSLDVSVSYRQQTPSRELHTENCRLNFAISPVWIRHAFGSGRRMPGDSVARNGQFEYYSRPVG